MLSIEAGNFIEKEMKPRWPDWKPNTAQVADWTLWLNPYSWEVAQNAVREHAGTQTYNKRPNAAKLRPLLAKYQPHTTVEKKGMADPTVFIFYAGGGRGTLLSGYFFPVIVLPHEQSRIMQAAANERGKREEAYGGDWQVHQDTTHSAMVKLRRAEDVQRIEERAAFVSPAPEEKGLYDN